jgi:hypothetical protein
MRNWFLILLFTLIITCIFGFSSSLHAQSYSDTSLVNSLVPQSSISVNIIPKNPGPNETVNVSIDSYATDLNSATVTWRVNGEKKQSGVGLKKFSFTTGNINVTTNLTIIIQTREGETIEKVYRIKPTSVDLIWQSESIVPPFYKGKALFSYQNKIKFIALPHITGSNGQEISAKKLIYKWKKNGTVLGDYSGYGMNTYTMIDSVISRPINIEVEVTSPDDNGVGYANTTVTPVKPTIVMYEKNPLYGIQFQKALVGTQELSDSKEINVIGAPFFFGTTNSNDTNLVYKWAINGKQISNNEDRTTQVFRQKEGTVGISKISLSIENELKILQSASNSFNLSFGDTD